MAFEDIDFFNSLWLANGLEYLLLPQDASAGKGILAHSDERKQSADTQTPSRPGKHTSFAPEQPYKKVSMQNGPLPEKTSPEAGHPGAAGNQAPWQPMDIASWPQILQQQLAATKKGLIAWTYLKLGEDLLSTKSKASADNERSARANFLRRLFKDLAHPAGTHTFWPVSLPPEQNINANMGDIFWSAMPHLGCRGVIVMGSEAAKIIAPQEKLKPLILVRPRGRFVWVLWEIDTLVATPEKYGQVLVFLRQALRAFVHN